MSRPPARDSPSPGEAAGPQDAWGEGLCSFRGTVQKEALVARDGGERQGMAHRRSDRGWGLVGLRCRRSDRGWGLVGLRCGRGPGWGPPDLGVQRGLSHGPVRRKKKGGWSGAPGDEGCGGRALLSEGPGKYSRVPHPMGTAGGPRSRRRAIPGCLAGEAAGSAEPHTRAHTPQEHAQCGPENFLPSREPLWPPPGPQIAKLGATGLASRGRGARLSPFRVPVPCLAFPRPQTLISLAASATGNRGMHVIHRSPRPGRRPGGQRPGGVAACRVDPLAVRSPHARTPRGEHTGWKGVCERGDVGAHTRCHTQSRGFVATAP